MKYLIHPVCDDCNLRLQRARELFLYLNEFYGFSNELFIQRESYDIDIRYFRNFNTSFFICLKMESHQQTVILVSTFLFSSKKKTTFRFPFGNENKRKSDTEMQEKET